MKKKVLILLLLIFIPFIKVKALDINYQAHVQQRDWMPKVSNGEMTGTSGLSLRMEAIKIDISNSECDGDVEYQVHAQNNGWMGYVSSGELAGTTGKGLRMEAIKIRLTGELGEKYNVFYRAHIQNVGWQPWVKNDEEAGTTGKGLRMEALEIKLISKDNVSVLYSSHSSEGWQDYVTDGKTSGSTGKSLSLDQIKIQINIGAEVEGNIKYQVFGVNGWEEEKTNDMISGSTNISIEALRIRLTGDLEKKFNVFYRVHASYIGWMGWTSNNKVAGTLGYCNKIEAVEIKILAKEDSSIIDSTNASKEGENNISYSSHVQGYGWQNYVSQGTLAGSTGQNLRLEAIKIKLNTVLPGDISYKAYIDKRGWSSLVNSDGIAGTTGLGRNIEAFSISLTGNISEYYDIYYRTHVSRIGWLDWAKNGEISGCLNSDTKIEAIEIQLIRKGQNNDFKTGTSYVTGHWVNNNYYDYYGKKATGFKIIDGIKHYFNPEGKLYGKNVQKIIDVSSWQGTIDWETIKKNEDVDAAIIRVGWGTSYNDPCGTDSYLDRNIKEVQRLGIPYGVYIYAYAETTQAAEKEAEFVISKMKQYNMSKGTYVWYDAEIKSISRNTYNSVIPAFINKIKANGYGNVGVYSGVSQLDTTNGNTNTPTIRSYPIWVSQYYKDLQYTGTYKGWQFASDEQIAGISGNVDCSMFFK